MARLMNKKLLLTVAVSSLLLLAFIPRLKGERILLDFGVSIKNRTYAVIEITDQSNYGGFFKSNGIVDYLDIMAIFQVESAWDEKARRENDGGPGDHALGLGQMLISTARDIGYTPEQLLQTGYAVQSTLKYLKVIYDYLSAQLGRAPTRSQWLGAYNKGMGAIARGATNPGYMLKINAAKLTLKV